MSTKASSTSTSTDKEHADPDSDLDFVKVQGEPIANVRNNTHDNPHEHIYSVHFAIERERTGVTVRTVRCSCPADTYHDGPCKHREGAMNARGLLAELLRAHEPEH